MEETVKKVRVKKAKVIGLNQLLAKKYVYLDGLPEVITRSFGALVKGFIMLIWGASGNGKSSMVYDVLRVLMKYGTVLYVALEEGMEATTQLQALRHLQEQEHGGRILFTNHEMTYEELRAKLRKKKSPDFVVIDSVQYWDINYAKYKALKEEFPGKGFIFISHSKGNNPDGKTADKIRYDAGVKVRVEGFVAFVTSRYGGNKPYIIWEEGAVGYWKRKKVNEFKK